MVTDEIRNSLQQALTELRIAEFELNRPHEDVVTMSVCYSARHSLVTMLRLFLMSNDVDQSKGNSLKDLLNQCINIDSQFSTIDVSEILCNELDHQACDGKYCLTVDKVNECVAVTNKFKTLVLEKMKINELK
jgi:hypothetical protein